MPEPSGKVAVRPLRAIHRKEGLDPGRDFGARGGRVGLRLGNGDVAVQTCQSISIVRVKRSVAPQNDVDYGH